MQQKEILEQQPFYIGNWLVSPAKNQIQSGSIAKTIQPKLIEVLTFLCFKHNEIVSADELIKQCWPNQFVSDNPIHKCIAQLRKALGDSSKHPKYIATIPKRGYSVIAKVSKFSNRLKPIKPYWLESSPFKGLRKYTSSEHSIFFGRTKAIADILSLIDQNQRGSTALIMVLGQSGCGKSSLVQAGILPKLINPYKPFKNQYVKSYTFIVESNEFKFVDKSLVSFLYDNKILSHTHSIEKYYKYLSENIETLKDYINSTTITELQDHESKVLVIFIDQLEYIFSDRTSSKSIENFFKIIAVLRASKKCLIIAALRNEYYQELTESHSYLKIRSKAYHYDVPPLSYDEICDIVRKPAEAAGLTYQINPENHISLDTFLINKAQSIQVNLPILQHTLSELYKNRNGNVLSYSVYKNNGGMEGGLSTMAENTFQDLPIKAQVKFEQLLHNLIQINPDGKDLAVCKKAAIKLIDDIDLKSIIEIFTDKRLFQTQWINGEPYLSITHDILIKNWPRLQLWVKKNTVLLNTQHEVKVATNRWLHHKKNKDFLFNSQQPILAANHIVNTHNVNLNSDEKTFIAASNRKFLLAKRLKLGLVGSLLISMLLLSILTLSVNSKKQQINKTKNNAENLISFILFDLKDKLAPLGRVDLLDLVGSEATQYFANIGVENLSPTSLLHYIKALQIVGEASFTQGEYDKSYLHFSESDVVISNALIQDGQNVVLLEKHMLNNYWLGYIKFIEKNYIEAGQFWQKYLMLAQILSRQEPKQQTWLLETSYALNNLGTLSLAGKQLGLANKYFSDSIEIKKNLLITQPGNQQLIADLADSVSWLGKVKHQEGSLTAKLKINQESLKLSRELILISPNNPIWLHRLSIALHRVALSFYDFGDLKQSQRFIEESIGIMEPLVTKDPDNFILKKELINNYLLRAKNYRHQHDFDKALFTIQKSQLLVDLFKTNLKFTKKIIQYNINLLVEQALVMSKLNQKETALQVLQKALNLSQNHLNEHEYGVLSVALIQLSKVKIQNSMPNFNVDGNDLKRQVLKQVHTSLLPLISKTSNNYEAMAMYLYVMRQSHISGIDYESDYDFATKLKQIYYQNPDFSPASFDSDENELKTKAAISLSYN